MAGARPIDLHPDEWMLLRNLSHEQFRHFLTDAEDRGVFSALISLRARFPREFPQPIRRVSNGI